MYCAVLYIVYGVQHFEKVFTIMSQQGLSEPHTHQKMADETYEQNQGQWKESHSKWYSQDCSSEESDKNRLVKKSLKPLPMQQVISHGTMVAVEAHV